jgi:hypothetical protein
MISNKNANILVFHFATIALYLYSNSQYRQNQLINKMNFGSTAKAPCYFCSSSFATAQYITIAFANVLEAELIQQ